MKIGVCSPFMPHELEDLLDGDSRDLLRHVKGVTATPVTPLVRAWHEQGFALAVFCLDQSVAEPVRLTGVNLTIDVLPKRRFRQSMMDCYRQERLLICDAIKRENPDVISAQWSYEHALGALDSGVPTVVTCHDTPLRYAWVSKTLFMTYHVGIAAAVFRRAAHLIAVSPYTAEHIRKYFRPKAKPKVIPNGIASDTLERGRRRFEAEVQARTSVTFCSVGGWGRIKNIPTLLNAFQLVKASAPRSRLVLYGRDLGKGEVAHIWAVAKGLTEGVEFRGSAAHSEVLDFLETEADVMVHPSLVETHGMVIIEAMACGVIVVGGKGSGAVPWTMGDGGFGHLCDVRSPASMAATMMAASTPDPSLARRAWQSVADRFTTERAAAENLSVLEELHRVASVSQ